MSNFIKIYSSGDSEEVKYIILKSEIAVIVMPEDSHSGSIFLKSKKEFPCYSYSREHMEEVFKAWADYLES